MSTDLNPPILEQCVVYVTCGSENEADTLAKTIVEERLAACVNIIPNIRSIYAWEGAIQNEQEWLLVIKTIRPTLDRLYQRIRQLHIYTVPEFIALPLLAGSPEYLNWVTENASGS